MQDYYIFLTVYHYSTYFLSVMIKTFKTRGFLSSKYLGYNIVP